MTQNFRLFHVPNLSVRNFLFFLLMYPGSLLNQPRRFQPDKQYQFGGRAAGSGAAAVRYRRDRERRSGVRPVTPDT